MENAIQYIIQFLLGEHVSPEIARKIGYTADKNEFHKFKTVIVPSNFFDEKIYGTEQSLPELPLKILDEIPILYGNPKIETAGKTVIIRADIIASAYFLISRYEEFVRKTVRDVHGRFPGKESLPYRAGFIDRPIVDDYGILLRSILRGQGEEIAEPPKEISKIYLTHDVDRLTHFRSIRGLAGGLLRGIRRPKEAKAAMHSFFGSLKNDPWYTFPFLFKLDASLRDKIGETCQPVVFIRSRGKRREDKPFPNLLHPDYKALICYCKRRNITIGLHSSYEAGINPQLITEEKQRLERLAKINTSCCRSHFLCSREPQDMMALIDAGITDDFTMSYADMAGFRLGTCRPVKWINPATMTVQNLTLHSLAIMDMSLSDRRYMFMNAHDAEMYCCQLADHVKNHNGELVLLWHNTSVEHTHDSYHRDLYAKIIKYLQDR
jgi:hypothetical protein